MKKTLILSLVALSMLFFSFVAYAAPVTPNFPEKPSLKQIEQLGAKISDIKKSDKGIKEVAKVFNSTITASDIEIVIESAKIHGKNKTKNQVLDYYIMAKAVANKAEELEIYPSDQETAEFISDIFDSIAKDEENNEEVMAELKGRGITKQEYINTHFEQYKELFAAYKLRDYFYSENDLKEADPHEANKLYRGYIDSLVQEADFEILDSSYFES